MLIEHLKHLNAMSSVNVNVNVNMAWGAGTGGTTLPLHPRTPFCRVGLSVCCLFLFHMRDDSSNPRTWCLARKKTNEGHICAVIADATD